MHCSRLRSILLTGLLISSTATATLAQRPAPDNAKKLAQACNHFAAKLYPELARRGTPTCSPGSIAMALYMLLAGARGETQSQLAHVLELPPELRGEALLAAAAGLTAAGPTGKHKQILTVRNDLWTQRGTTLATDYTDLLRKHLGAQPRELDFRKDANAARQTINRYIAKATNQRIVDLLQPNAITADTRAVLTNALWFRGAWREPFYANNTKGRPFTLSDGSKVAVPTMRSVMSLGYAANNNWECVMLPFAKSHMHFEVLVPRDGKTLQVAEAAMLAGKHLGIAGHQKVDLQLPRFRTAGRHNLGQTLSQLGMRDAFDANKADFRGIDAHNRVQVSDVVHQTWIQVDEKGCEAAAATAVVLTPGSSMTGPRSVRIDRPFCFGLRDTRTGLLWIAGRISDPRADL